jgi:hypothetical protein
MTDWLLPWLQLLVNCITAVLVFCYLIETYKLRVASQNQVSEIRKQVALSQAQIEGPIRPAVVVRQHGGIQLQNIGNGAAVNVAWALIEGLDGELNWPIQRNALEAITAGYLEVREDPERAPALADQRLGPNAGIQLHYQSLSGKHYCSLVTFGANGLVLRTRFLDWPD